ncbi:MULTISPECIES: nucleoside triphosphate pyrophosphohydrolase [Sporosarcina]|uniref:nucleoside triphosphate pyrophosphohydrolase n=1 Tax=Sporosarcina TaxID=1569 RepID=UPI00058FBB91|nr:MULTISPECIES: nucleoside triphosphate pyrophosphohydrolase [Sporosarcina]WJY27526.1 nucleoside triphosphate pyrophosphohydrolase [Sporosarcina sp. 0.2-SM1T-5]
MPTYNKLVRDLIPQIIENDGKTPVTRVLSGAEFAEEVKRKLAEELSEYEEAATSRERLEELADLLELVYAAASLEGADEDALQVIREEKRALRGSFDERLYLVEVQDD